MITAPQGFPTWLALYKYLQQLGMADEQRVALCYPQEMPEAHGPEETISEAEPKPTVKNTYREETMYVDEIKARAFEEIYDLLPEVAAMGIVRDMLETAAKMPGVNKHVRPAIEFLKKIPTRS